MRFSTVKMPTRHMVKGLLTVALLAGLVSAVQAQTGRITGTVVAAATGEALAKASIEAVGTIAARKLGTLTDKTGRYAMEGVPVGTYTLEASFVGYRIGRVENVRVGEGEVRVLPRSQRRG